MILIVGEILMDVFKNNNSIEAHPGGAPFNVAYNVAFFGGDVAFYGSVGCDDYGCQLYDFSKKINLKQNLIKKLENRRTTVALVSLDQGERSFRFLRDDGTDYQFDFERFKTIDLSEINIVHFGSLMLSHQSGREFLNKAIEYLRQFPHIQISFDVNYRDDIFEDTNSKSFYLNVIEKSDLIKISEDEVHFLSECSSIEEGLNQIFHSQQHVFLSLGQEGSCYYHEQKLIKAKTIKVHPVDTTGAGDSFYSYILYCLDKDKNILLDAIKVQNMLERANIVGAYATTKKGAIGVVPSADEIVEIQKNEKK